MIMIQKHNYDLEKKHYLVERNNFTKECPELHARVTYEEIIKELTMLNPTNQIKARIEELKQYLTPIKYL